MAKHDLPETKTVLCKFCKTEVSVVKGTEHWMKPTDQFLVGHPDNTGFPFCPGSGIPLHAALDPYVNEKRPEYMKLWEKQKLRRYRAAY